MFWAPKRLLTLLEGNSWFSELYMNTVSFNSSLREKWFPALKYNWWILEISFSAISRSWVCFKRSTSSQKRQAASPSVWKRKRLNSYMSEAPEKAYCSSVDKEQANVNKFIMQSWGAGLITRLENTDSQVKKYFCCCCFVFVESGLKAYFCFNFSPLFCYVAQHCSPWLFCSNSWHNLHSKWRSEPQNRGSRLSWTQDITLDSSRTCVKTEIVNSRRPN